MTAVLEGGDDTPEFLRLLSSAGLVPDDADRPDNADAYRRDDEGWG